MEWLTKEQRRKKFLKENHKGIKGWVKINHEKNKFYWKVHKAIKLGKIKKGICEICKRKRKICAHHDDYNKYLKVRWLCKSCHSKLHGHLREGIKSYKNKSKVASKKVSSLSKSK